MEEITRVAYRLFIGYFIRFEEAEENNEPMLRSVVHKLKNNAHSKQEQVESL